MVQMEKSTGHFRDKASGIKTIDAVKTRGNPRINTVLNKSRLQFRS